MHGTPPIQAAIGNCGLVGVAGAAVDMEELLEVPQGATPGSTIQLQSRTGGTISFTVPSTDDQQAEQQQPVSRGAALRAEGNELFRAAEYRLAAKAYTQATRVIGPTGSADELAACWLNLAACRLKLGQPGAAVAACDTALSHRQTAKGLYRRALARKKLAEGGTPEGGAGAAAALALADAEAALGLDDRNAAVRRLAEELGQLQRTLAAAEAQGARQAEAAAAEAKQRRTQRGRGGSAGEQAAPSERRDDGASRPAARPELPAIQEFFGDSAVPVSLEWSEAHGRHLVAKRALPAGSVVLAADAFALIPTGGQQQDEEVQSDDSALGQRVLARLEQLEFSHDDDVELVSEVLQTADAVANRSAFTDQESKGIRRMEMHGDKESLRLAALALVQSAQDTPAEEQARGVHYRLSFQDVADLMSHESHIKKRPEDWAALRNSAQLLRRALGAAPAAASEDSVLGSLTVDGMASLLLRIKYNAHAIHNSDSHSRKVGLGLFPAAAYINHGCSANVVYSHVNGGRTIVFRALRPIAAGETVVYSYIEPLQPVEERRQLLSDAFLIPKAVGQRGGVSAKERFLLGLGMQRLCTGACACRSGGRRTTCSWGAGRAKAEGWRRRMRCGKQRSGCSAASE